MSEALADRLRGVGLATILVVEDDPTQLVLWRLWFELAGHEVVDACDGVMALERIKYRSPHVVVTDMCMPAMSGGELIRQLRADPVTARIPIVGMSTQVRHRDIGEDAFLSKPLDPNDLIEAAETLIERTSRGPVQKFLARSIGRWRRCKKWRCTLPFISGPSGHAKAL
jgi:CheY-like chemotaxis protein